MILAITLNPAIDKAYFINGVQLGKAHRPEKAIDSAGGKGLNVARAAVQLGSSVVASGFLGGSNGSCIRKMIKAAGIEDAFVEIEGQTRICINITDMQTQQCTEVLERGPVIAKEEAEAFLYRYGQLLEQADVVTISGSLPEGLESSFYAELAAMGTARGKRVLLDTSGAALAEGIKAKPYLVKPNMDELAVLYPDLDRSLEGGIEAVQRLKRLGIELPVVTMGRKGAVAGLSDGIYKVMAPPVEAVNSVGSGDAFIAGCAVSLDRGMDEKSLARHAAACGSANAQSPQTGHVEAGIAASFFSETAIQKIADYE